MNPAMNELFPQGALVFDLIFPTPPPQGALTQVLGRAAPLFGAVEADPEIEQEVPRAPLMKGSDRRILIGQVGGGLLSEMPDMRPFLQLLLGLIDRTGARVGTAHVWGSKGFFGAAGRDRADLVGLGLLGWLEDPSVGLDFGPPISGPASPQKKLADFEAKKKALVDAKVDAQLGAIPTGPYWVVDLLGKLGGKSEEEYSAWLKKALSAFKTATAPVEKPKPPEPPKEAPKAPIRAAELGGKPILVIPRERFELATFEGVARGRTEIFHKIDQISGRVVEEVARKRVPFVAALPSLGELFLDGKILDKAAVERIAEPVPGAQGVLSFVAQVPRFGRVRVLGRDGKYLIASDSELEPEKLLPFLDEL